MDPNIVVTKTPTLGNSSSVTTARPSIPAAAASASASPSIYLHQLQHFSGQVLPKQLKIP